MKMATKLHECKCGPCHLCEQESTKYTHLEKMDCVVAKFICDLFMQRSVYVMHATNKHRQMLIIQLFSQLEALTSCSVDMSDETVYRNTNMACREQIEKLVGQKLVPIVLLPLVLHSVSPTICMSITASMQDNHTHPT